MFNKSYTKNWSKEIFVTDSTLETNTWTYEIKVLKEKKNFWWVNHKWIVIRNQVVISEIK